MVYVTHGRREVIEGQFEKDVRYLLNSVYTNAHLFTLSERGKYKPSEDENVWKQNRGLVPECVEIYYKGDWICDVFSNMTRNEIVNKFSYIFRGYLKKKEEEALKGGGKDVTGSITTTT